MLMLIKTLIIIISNKRPHIWHVFTPSHIYLQQFLWFMLSDINTHTNSLHASLQIIIPKNKFKEVQYNYS